MRSIKEKIRLGVFESFEVFQISETYAYSKSAKISESDSKDCESIGEIMSVIVIYFAFKKAV